MKIIILCLIAAIVVNARSILSSGKVVLAHSCVEKGTCRVHDYVKESRLSANDNHTVTIWLRQNSFAANCPNMLEEVSNPQSPKYGKYYSFHQLHDMTWDKEAIASVTQYLQSFGIRADQFHLAPNGEFITVNTKIGVVEKMFNAEFYRFSSSIHGKSLRRSLSYTIPSHMTDYVSLVSGITNFPMYSKHTQVSGHNYEVKRAQNFVTPQLIVTTYHLPANDSDATPKSTQAVFESLGQSYDPNDLKLFEQTFKIPPNPIQKVIGPNNPTDCANNIDNCAEASLDVEYIMALAWNAPTWYWSIDVNQGGDIFLDFIQAVAQNANPPQVYSISYGGPEHLQDPNVMINFNTEVCKMGLRGFTVFASSGDDGVAGYEARTDINACGFNPEYPALCPFITAVGATMGPESGNNEIACTSVPGGSIITTGGGFSATFTRPTWQDTAVNNYLNNPNVNLPSKTLFASGGRAFPDIAALGNNYVTVINKQEFLLSGTSASSPVFCAMVTLVNGYRELAGKGPLGFLNPLLYQLDRTVYNDIASGINNCCAGQNPVCCPNGFTAAAGWDPLTGLGSIDFAKFTVALQNLP